MVQSYAGTHLNTLWAADSAQSSVSIQMAWDGVNYKEEATRVLDWRIESSLYTADQGLPHLGQGPASRASITLDNSDGRFSADNAAGPLYANIASGIYQVPVMIYGGYYCPTHRDHERLIQFTGEIVSSYETESGGRKAVTLACTDRSIEIAQAKHSTALYLNYRPDEIMAAVLAALGVAHTSLDYAMSITPYGWLDDENALREMQQLAASDGGWVRFRKDGTFLFERLTHWLEAAEHTTVQANLTRSEGFYWGGALAWRDTYTGVVVEYSSRYKGGEDIIYQSPDDIQVGPGATVSKVCKLRSAITSYIPPVVGTDYHAVSGGMADMQSSLTITIPSATAYAQRVTVQFANSHSYLSCYVKSFQLRGYPVLGEEAQEVEAGTVTGENAKALAVRPDTTRNIPPNPWIQTAIQAQRLAGFYSDRLGERRRLIEWRGVCCPYLELGDRVRVTTEDGITHECYILSMNQGKSTTGMYSMELLLLPCANLYAHARYFQWGVDSYAVTSEPVFY